MTCVLRPLNGVEEDWVQHVPDSNPDSLQQPIPTPESASYDFVSLPGDPGDPSGIPLEAHRELRIKLFMGEVVLFVHFGTTTHSSTIHRSLSDGRGSYLRSTYLPMRRHRASFFPATTSISRSGSVRR